MTNKRENLSLHNSGFMGMINQKDIEKASQRISGYIRKTPVIKVSGEDFGIDAEIYLKLEFLQHTGSFKPRGALIIFYNRM